MAILICPAFGGMSVIGGVASQNVNVPEKLTQFTVNDSSENLTVDHTADEMTIQIAGRYIFWSTITITGAAGIEYWIEPYVDPLGVGAPVASGFTNAIMVNAGADLTELSVTGVLDLNVGDIVSMFVASDTAAQAFAVQSGQLEIQRQVGL